MMFMRKRRDRNLKTVTITPQVWNEMRRTIGSSPAETGGVLGSGDNGRTIDHYYFDSTAYTTAGTYTPNIDAVNKVVARWNDQGIRFVGFIHSHPKGNTAPSAEDIKYAKKIMEVL